MDSPPKHSSSNFAWPRDFRKLVELENAVKNIEKDFFGLTNGRWLATFEKTPTKNKN